MKSSFQNSPVPHADAQKDSLAAEKLRRKNRTTDAPPSWVRLMAGMLGFFTSLLSLATPAIVLLIVDRVIPSSNSYALWGLLGLGLGTIFSVSLIDLMRMRALEAYFTNVRGLVHYQDACFALFWSFTMVFIHPALMTSMLLSASILFLLWSMRRERNFKRSNGSRGLEAEPALVDSVGLGAAYVQKAALGEISGEEQPDFQTVGQTSVLGFVQMVSSLLSLIIAGALHINGFLSLGTAIAAIFVNQYVVSIFVRFYQVQALKPARPDLSIFSNFEIANHGNSSSSPSDGDLVILSVDQLENKEFAAFSADVFQGLCLAFIGPSGSGKSAILRAIATGEFTEGKITYKGRNWGRNHGRFSSLSYTPPSPICLKGSLVDNVTCFEPTADPLLAVELIRKLDPYEDVFQNVDFLSAEVEDTFSAQGQIISLARAFWRDSEILVLDSPETYLDKASKSALMALILKAKTDGKIVLLATDDDYLMSAADEVVKLERGEVTDRGPMQEVLARHHSRWVRVSFFPTKRDAFRLQLWLESQFPEGMSNELRARVKHTAQDMLFLAPRDQVLNANDEILFDVRMNTREAFITMHDKGDVILADQMADGSEGSSELARIIGDTDGFDQTLREGYRQFAAHFTVDRVNDDDGQTKQAVGE